MMQKYGPTRRGRAACSAALLALLAVCGYVGAQEPAVQAASVPVSRIVMPEQDIAVSSAQDTRARLREARTQEIALLDSVLADSSADGEMHRIALEQKTALTLRMENEAELEAALSYMGFGGMAVICGSGSVTVFAPEQVALDESARVRIIDAAASQTGLYPGDVKIILAKK